VQRRHQKLIEETPAPGLRAGLPEEIGQAAIRGADAAGYTGVGTFEFLVDDEGSFYFIEVNCRIQVEHPVTEMVTGVDLVAEQLRIAAGEPLSLRQSDVSPRGAAIECRLNAEDPSRGFAPTPGTLDHCELPAGPWVRVDAWARQGSVISSAYDSLLAKVITWGRDRDEALARMRRALRELHVGGVGVRTTRDFLAEVLDHPAFVAAAHDTGIVDLMTADRELLGPGRRSRRVHPASTGIKEILVKLPELSHSQVTAQMAAVAFWKDEYGTNRGSGSDRGWRRSRPVHLRLLVRSRSRPPAGGTARGHFEAGEGALPQPAHDGDLPAAQA